MTFLIRSVSRILHYRNKFTRLLLTRNGEKKQQLHHYISMSENRRVTYRMTQKRSEAVYR